MTLAFSPRRIISMVALTFAWCALWGSVTVANATGGLLLSAVLTSSAVSTSYRGSVRLVPLAKLIGLVMVDLAKSTISVAEEILTPTDHTDEAIIGIDLPSNSRDHMLLLVVAVTLTPGTAVVDVDSETGTMYLHLLHDQRRDETLAHVHRLARLAGDALPVRSGATA